ncbi:GNAT family N-acetyltransferase [Escherichia coli]|nr:GNAT family N-acetyltransferase [Escherichia coli]MDZ9796373.1 GNAT family N-acetyltransferase [Escherichia coli]MEA0387989.1 GNAT family N-acetyltransferase [Escherichia coli]
MKDYLCKKLFNRLSGTLVIRARCGNNITGLACCNILYPSPRYSGQLHIKELYVSQCDRNKGTGKAIMRFIARLALEQECLSLSWGTVAKLAMRQPFVLFKGLTFQKLCLPGAFRPGDHHNKMLRPGLCVVHASPQYL